MPETFSATAVKSTRKREEPSREEGTEKGALLVRTGSESSKPLPGGPLEVLAEGGSGGKPNQAQMRGAIAIRRKEDIKGSKD